MANLRRPRPRSASRRRKFLTASHAASIARQVPAIPDTSKAVTINQLRTISTSFMGLVQPSKAEQILPPPARLSPKCLPYVGPAPQPGLFSHGHITKISAGHASCVAREFSAFVLPKIGPVKRGPYDSSKMARPELFARYSPVEKL